MRKSDSLLHPCFFIRNSKFEIRNSIPRPLMPHASCLIPHASSLVGVKDHFGEQTEQVISVADFASRNVEEECHSERREGSGRACGTDAPVCAPSSARPSLTLG